MLHFHRCLAILLLTVIQFTQTSTITFTQVSFCQSALIIQVKQTLSSQLCTTWSALLLLSSSQPWYNPLIDWAQKNNPNELICHPVYADIKCSYTNVLLDCSHQAQRGDAVHCTDTSRTREKGHWHGTLHSQPHIYLMGGCWYRSLRKVICSRSLEQHCSFRSAASWNGPSLWSPLCHLRHNSETEKIQHKVTGRVTDRSKQEKWKCIWIWEWGVHVCVGGGGNQKQKEKKR